MGARHRAILAGRAGNPWSRPRVIVVRTLGLAAEARVARSDGGGRALGHLELDQDVGHVVGDGLPTGTSAGRSVGRRAFMAALRDWRWQADGDDHGIGGPQFRAADREQQRIAAARPHAPHGRPVEKACHSAWRRSVNRAADLAPRGPSCTASHSVAGARHDRGPLGAPRDTPRPELPTLTCIGPLRRLERHTMTNSLPEEGFDLPDRTIPRPHQKAHGCSQWSSRWSMMVCDERGRSGYQVVDSAGCGRRNQEHGQRIAAMLLDFDVLCAGRGPRSPWHRYGRCITQTPSGITAGSQQANQCLPG